MVLFILWIRDYLWFIRKSRGYAGIPAWKIFFFHQSKCICFANTLYQQRKEAEDQRGKWYAFGSRLLKFK